MFEPLWSFPLHHRVGAWLADGDDVVVAARKTRLACLDGATGAARWTTRAPHPWGDLAVTDELVVYLAPPGRLLAVDRHTGEPRWTRELAGWQGWLHAANGTVIVGGWRGYTDLCALDAATGEERWTRPARGRGLHATRVHDGTGCLLVADPADGGVLRFLRLADGAEQHRIAAPGAWTTTPRDARAPDSARGGEPLLLTRTPAGLYVVDPARPAVRTLDLPAALGSTHRACIAGWFPWLTPGGELWACRVGDGHAVNLGGVEHNAGWLLPFQPLADGGFRFGSSSGTLTAWSASGERLASRHRVGKRIGTPLAVTGGVLAFGTASGEVVGVAVGPPPGARRPEEP